MGTHSLIALHGFLGLPSDWDSLGLESLHPFNLNSFSHWNTLQEWARAFNDHMSQFFSGDERPILMGYSLGGRLALHALIHNPLLWGGGIVISAHPGLDQAVAKQSRLEEDKKWAKRFQQDPWEELMETWNSRSIFSQDSFVFRREAKDYCRKELASLLEKSSLGYQENLRDSIYQLPLPILWLVGEKDQTYSRLSHTLSFQHSHSCCRVIPNAGHRVPWEQPLLFKTQIESFLVEIKKCHSL